MSLITPHHLYDVRPVTVASSSPQTRESTRLSLFEEAWLQLPRRRAGDVSADSAPVPASQASSESRPRA